MPWPRKVEPAPEPSTKAELFAHAAQLLHDKWDRRPMTIIAVNPESILFIDANKAPRTAWFYSQNGQQRICVEPGFPAWPSAALHLPDPRPAAPTADARTEPPNDPPDPSQYAD